MEQFYFTNKVSAIFDNCRELSMKINRGIIGDKPTTPINSILVYSNKNKRMELLKTKNSKSLTVKVITSPKYILADSVQNVCH